MLLPLTEANVRALSLPLHLALATCRCEGGGNAHQVNELLRALYVTFYLQKRGLGALPLSVFTSAEAGVNAALARVKETKLWQINEETALLFEQVLRAHDEQLATISLRDLTSATERLKRFILGTRVSPLPGSLLKSKDAVSVVLAAADEVDYMGSRFSA
jgi:hypothetical protein